MNHCKTLIHASHIITQNENRDILVDASIAIEGDKIIAIGPQSQMRQNWHADSVLELGHKLLMPGLVNAHTHAAMTFLRGIADDLPLMSWLTEKIFPVEARLTEEIVYLGSLLGHAEMLATGTTACLDMYIFENAVFDAAQVAGLRCMGGEAIFMFPSAACANWRSALERTEELALKYANDDKIKVAINPHSVYTTNEEILRACRDIAIKYSLPIHIHLAETQQETKVCLDENGMRPIAWCEANGLFDTEMIAAHLVHVNETEIVSLAKHGVRGAHNPSSNMKLASGGAPLSNLIKNGMKMGLGTDGPASNNTLSMFMEMGRAALLHKYVENDPEAIPAPVILDMATRGGAEVLGNPFIGSLAPGQMADVIALDLALPNMQPLHNPVSQIVYAASGQECRLTMVGGEILYQDGKFTRFNYEDLLVEAKKLKDFVRKKS